MKIALSLLLLQLVLASGMSYTQETSTKINIAEMEMLLEEHKPSTAAPSYTLRGMVLKNDKLSAKNRFALTRIMIICCAADAIAVGIQVPYSKFSPESIKDKSWVQVTGHLHPTTKPLKDEFDIASTKVQVVNTDIISQWELIPDAIVPISPPKDPYITDWKEKAPFAY